jgi:Domain of unknown function (DUF4845)
MSVAGQRSTRGEANMRKNQLGLSMLALMAGGAIFIAVALLGMKLAPSYIEFFAIKKAVNAIGVDARNGATAAALRKTFDARAIIDAIESVKGSDLEITKDQTGLVVSVGYRKEVPLAGNVGIYIDFSAVSQ